MTKKAIVSLVLATIMSLTGLPAITFALAEEKKPEIAAWEDWHKSAVTFTFDDGAPSHIDYVAPAFDEYGFKASFYLVVNWTTNWAGFQELADNGHEIGSHSNSHGQNMSGEEASSKQNISQNITSKYGCLTVAYPNCNIPNTAVVQQNYIAGRIGNGSWQGIPDIMGKDGPQYWYQVPALITGSETDIKTAADFTEKMQTAKNDNGWVVFLTHGIQGKSNGNATYSPTDLDSIKGALAWANDNDIWVTSMCRATMYIKERNAAELTLSSSNAASDTYTLTHQIADNVCKYDYPLSVRVPAPEGCLVTGVKQNGEAIDYEIKDGMVYCGAVPNGGDLVISKGKETIASATLSYTSSNFSGKAKKPSVVVKNRKGEVLKEGSDYIVDYKNNVNAGTATVSVCGIGNYSGVIDKSYQIQALSIKKMTAKLSYTSCVFSGSLKKPTVSVGKLKSGTDFTVTYKNNKQSGKATVTIKGIGNYKDTITKTFKILPKKPTVSKLIPGKKCLTVKMSTLPKSQSATTYQIAYKKNGSGIWKYTTATKQYKTVNKLSTGKIYYVKVRAYKIVNSDKYYGAWSSTVKSKKIK